MDLVEISAPHFCQYKTYPKDTKLLETWVWRQTNMNSFKMSCPQMSRKL